MREPTTRLILPESADDIIARINALRAQLYAPGYNADERGKIADQLAFWRAKLAERLAR